MARKTFISYKYSEAKDLRNIILEKMGDDATYYNGETKDSPDMTENNNSTIEKKLRNMMYNTSVTIVIISPNMKKSNWIDWEIEYCLKETTRKNRTSKTNGIVGVVMKVNGNYDWFIEKNESCHGSKTLTYNTHKTFDIISKNRFNSNPPQIICDKCNTYDKDYGSYISFIKEEEFLKDIDEYIEIAFKKSENYTNYDIVKQI